MKKLNFKPDTYLPLHEEAPTLFVDIKRQGETYTLKVIDPVSKKEVAREMVSARRKNKEVTWEEIKDVGSKLLEKVKLGAS